MKMDPKLTCPAKPAPPLASFVVVRAAAADCGVIRFFCEPARGGKDGEMVREAVRTHGSRNLAQFLSRPCNTHHFVAAGDHE